MTLPMFRHRQQRRRWAAAVMLLLMFGLGAGAANACLISAQAASQLERHEDGHDDGHEQAHEHAHHAHHAHPAPHADTQAAQDLPSPLPSVHCQDFCAKAALSILPLKSALDDVQAAALVATAPAIVLPVPAFEPGPSWPLRRDTAPGPRILIALLRLAL